MKNLGRYRNILIIAIIAAIYFIPPAIGIQGASLTGVYVAAAVIFIAVCRAGILASIATISYSMGKKQFAKKLFALSVRNNTRNPRTLLNYGIILMHDGDSDGCIKHAGMALSFNPDEQTKKNARFIIASSHWMKGDIFTAVKSMEELVEEEQYTNIHALTSLGYLYIITGELDKARSTTEKALEIQSESAAAWDNMGQIYMKEDNLEEAEKAFLKSNSISGKLVDPAYFLGLINEKAGKLEEARDFYAQARSCKISELNTVTAEQVEAKYQEMMNILNTMEEDE